MRELASWLAIKSLWLELLSRDELFVVLGAVFLVDEVREHGLATEVLFLRYLSHNPVCFLLHQVALIFRQGLMGQNV